VRSNILTNTDRADLHVAYSSQVHSQPGNRAIKCERPPSQGSGGEDVGSYCGRAVYQERLGRIAGLAIGGRVAQDIHEQLGRKLLLATGDQQPTSSRQCLEDQRMKSPSSAIWSAWLNACCAAR
jgi:hypothetical protein